MKAGLKVIESFGMICSERELGISDRHDGILVLDEKDFTIGQPFISKQDNSDIVFDINVTPNRPDCLSMIGIAREVGILAEKKLKKPDSSVPETTKPTEKMISVDIIDPDACPRYSARVVTNVTIKESPHWLQNKLQSVGIRSINNVVDITNFVLMESGHPLHAFDYDLIMDQRIIVRKAKPNESFRTLDGHEHLLKTDDLLICDGQRGVALAGVMGGLNSEVTEKTKNILLESAYFDPRTIRSTARRLDMSSEASQRFERGADPNNTIFAVNRAAKLMAELANGEVTKGIVDAYPKMIPPKKISLRLSRVSQVLGKEIPQKDVVSILSGLDLDVQQNHPIRVTVPTFRPDLTHEIDLIEEIVRHYGFDKIEPNLNSVITLSSQTDERQQVVENIRDTFVGLGFIETLNTNLVPKEYISLFTPEPEGMVLKNPLSQETSCLRTSLIPTLLDSIRWNVNRSAENLRLFEIGKIFIPNDKHLPDEIMMIAGALTGSFRHQHFWGEALKPVNFFHLKGVIESFLMKHHIEGYQFISSKHIAFDPEITLAISLNNRVLGTMGQVRKSILEKWDIKNDVFSFEISVPDLYDVILKKKTFYRIPRFPAIKRDLAIVVDASVPIASMENLIRKKGGKLLSFIELFDLYKGKQIESGKKSAAFSLTFLDPNRTLEEEDVEPVISSIIKALKESFSATLRS